MLTLGTNESDARVHMDVENACTKLLQEDICLLTYWTFLVGRLESRGEDFVTLKIYGNDEPIKVFMNEIVFIDKMPMIPMTGKIGIIQCIENMQKSISQLVKS